MSNKRFLFLDSGAFSAFSKGEKIDIQKYIQFIKKHDFDFYACLDVIGDKVKGPTKKTAEQSARNQKIMEDAGLNPIPVFHRGEPEEYLEELVDDYEYIGLGTGRALGNRAQLLHWLDRIFEEIICDKNGNPKVKVHGFAVTSLDLLKRYPWYSVDSASPVIGAAFGKIFLPGVNAEGVFDFTDNRLVAVSDQSVHNKGIGSYINEPVINKRKYDKLFEEHGFEMGKIVGKKKRPTRKEKKKERKRKTPLLVDVAEEGETNGTTLANSWEERLRWNTIVWREMRKGLPFHTLADGEGYKSRIYSVCSSTGHLAVFNEIDPPPWVLASYVYLRGGGSFLTQVLEYEEQNNV